jgi:hypothetical protein
MRLCDFFVHKNNFFPKRHNYVSFASFLSAQHVRNCPQHAQALTFCPKKKAPIVVEIRENSMLYLTFLLVSLAYNSTSTNILLQLIENKSFCPLLVGRTCPYCTQVVWFFSTSLPKTLLRNREHKKKPLAMHCASYSLQELSPSTTHEKHIQSSYTHMLAPEQALPRPPLQFEPFWSKNKRVSNFEISDLTTSSPPSCPYRKITQHKHQDFPNMHNSVSFLFKTMQQHVTACPQRAQGLTTCPKKKYWKLCWYWW